MATYFTDDFADFTSGGPPTYGDWVARIKTAVSWTPAADVVVPAPATTDWNVLSWSDVEDGNHANVEVLAVVNFPTVATKYFLVLRGSGADESATHYVLWQSATNFRIYYCSGSDAPVQVATVAKSASTATDYWYRFRVNSSGPTSVKAKQWTGAIGDEPGTWDLDATDTSGPTAAGWNGLSGYSTGGGDTTIKQIGFGTNGDTAPSAAGGGAPAESGGTSSAVTVTAAGAGSAVEAASGGASASVTVTAAGAGTAAEQASGGASASVAVTAAGAGSAATSTSGGASAVVTVTAAGTGTATEAASGGASSEVSVTAVGAGTSSAGASGGSTAAVSVSAVGAGTAFQPASGGASASVLVTAAGAGLALEIVAGGSSAAVNVSAVGGGTDGAVVAGVEYVRLYSRITPAVVMPSAICPTVARSSPVAVRRDLRSTIDLESP